MPPLLGTLLRRGGGGKWSDNFNRSVSSGLGQMSAGPAWSVITGAWSDNGSKPTTSTSQGSNPLAVVTPGVSDVDTKLTVGAGDALYFRVQDASNWWRALWEGWQTSSCQTCCSTCCQTCTQYCTYNNYQCQASGKIPGASNCNGCPSCGSPYSCGLNGTCSQACGTTSCNCSSCNCTSCNCTYYDNYRLLTQKMVGGTLTTVHTGATYQGSSYATTVARVVTKGAAISTYSATSTAQYSGSDASLQSAKSYGIGRGASSYNTSNIDDFEISWK